MTRSMLQRVIVGLTFTAGGVACNSVLGFEEATVDPALAPVVSGEGGTQPQAFTCDSYCANIMKNCTGTQAEYLNEDICKAMCSHFDLGSLAHTSEDSLSCRSYHAISAADSPRDHCKHAGPTGAGHCGSQPCNAFCALTAAVCTGSLQPYPGGELGCRQDCAGYTYLSGPEDQELTTEGPSLNCRLWHLESAYDPANPQAKVTHCAHVGLVSTVCF